MMQNENLAGYDQLSPGVDEAPGSALQIAPVSIPELKSLSKLAVSVVLIAALYFGRDVLIPITLAVLLSFLLSPIVNLLQRLRLGRAPAVILTVFAALGVFGLVATLIGSQAASLTTDAPRYAKTIESKFQGIQSFAVARLASFTKEFDRPKIINRQVPPDLKSQDAAAKIATPSTAADPRPVLVEIASPELSPFAVAMTILQPILGPLETFLIVLIVAIFILFQREDLRDRFIRLFGSSDLHRTTIAMDDAIHRLSRYFLSQLAVNTGFAVVIGLGLWAIGLPSPAMWGVLAGLLRFVPYIGAILGAVAPAVLGAAIEPGWSTALYVMLLFVIVEPIVGYVVEPLIYGHTTGISPVSVIVSAVFWTWMWGPIGLIISTPLTLCLVVLGRHVKSLEFFDVLLGDRPALSATESFYQRILANNPDEALAQAETLLIECRLVDYYDGVIVEALALATEDVKLGSIERSRSRQMLHAVQSVIADLEDSGISENTEYAESVNAQSTQLGVVACVAGGGPFDEAVQAMMVQLLEQRSVTTWAVPNNAASRAKISELDLSEVAVIVLAHTELSQTPAQLRYLVKRLRQRAPKAEIVSGLWAQNEAALSDTTIQRIIGADRYAGSLQVSLDQTLTLLKTQNKRQH